MAEPVRPYRTFLLDARGDGQYLRATWHPHGRLFVVSHWQGDVCVAATRIGVAEAGELIGLLANGLADAAATPTVAPSAEPSPRPRRTAAVAVEIAATIRRRWHDRHG